MKLHLDIDQAVCTACGVCVDSCPTDVIRQREDGKPYPAFLADCQVCFLCVIDCPVDAISIAQTRSRTDAIGPQMLDGAVVTGRPTASRQSGLHG
jgi:NAD-dependent dihydropyrimidine dehydrogenase PreA subunit